jgi:hypothetical protein
MSSHLRAVLPPFLVLLLAAVAGGMITFVVILLLLLPAPPPAVPESLPEDGAVEVVPPEYLEEVTRLQARVAELEATLERREAEDVEDESPEQREEGRGTVEGSPEEQPSPLPQDAASLLQILEQALAMRDQQRATSSWKALQELLRRDPQLAVPALLATLARGPGEVMLKSLAKLLSRVDLQDHPDLLGSLRDGLCEAALAATDPGECRLALEMLDQLLRKHERTARLEEDQVANLAAILGDAARGGARQSALHLLLRMQPEHPLVADRLLALSRTEPDLDLRVQAIRGLRRTADDRADELMLELLRTEVEPRVLWDVAGAVNFLTQPTRRREEYKAAYRSLLRREVPDPARGRAAQSLALLATLDGDHSVATDLRLLASSTPDPALAEAARTVASQLEDGSASFTTIAKAWEAYHQTLDRQQYPW